MIEFTYSVYNLIRRLAYFSNHSGQHTQRTGTGRHFNLLEFVKKNLTYDCLNVALKLKFSTNSYLSRHVGKSVVCVIT